MGGRPVIAYVFGWGLTAWFVVHVIRYLGPASQRDRLAAWAIYAASAAAIFKLLGL